MSDARDTRLVKRREMAFLLRELELWRDLDLISDGQADQIRGLYAQRPGQLERMLLGVGGALVGLGALSFVAANWMDLSRSLRVLIIVGAYISSLVTAWGCGEDHPRASRAFLLLGGFVYGAGIFLMDQMFHQGGPWATAVGWWIVGLIPAALLFRDRWQLLLIQILSAAYMLGIKAIGPAFMFGRARGALPLHALLMPLEASGLLIVLWATWAWVRGRRAFNVNACLTAIFIASRLSRCFVPSAAAAIMIGLGLVVWLGARCRGHALTDDLAWWGLLVADASGTILAQPWTWKGSSLLEVEAIVSASLSWDVASPGAGLAMATMVCLAPLLLWQFHKGRAMGGVFFVLLIVHYFFDSILDFMSKGWSFTLLGATFLVIGIVIERRRRAGRDGERRGEA